ncbi:hypothetical protein ACFYQ5_30010 [Streptomyces sp. NPDC005794]|uniref:hypothetical protein n=1 Tax=Streptomyces sp. NPDC005794 TaxID=3364733 RepID=UPI00369A5408
MDTNLGYTATALSKAGWLTRANRIWRLTGLGLEALGAYPDEVTFLWEANARYDYWVSKRTGFDAAAKVLSTLPDERWVSLEDVAGEYDVDAEALAACLQEGTRPDGWHRRRPRHGGCSSNATSCSTRRGRASMSYLRCQTDG